MLEAHIVSQSGSLYFAGKRTAHDLAILRAHVRALAAGTPDVRLDVRATDVEWAGLLASGWLHRLARAGAWIFRDSASATHAAASPR
jgi:hypothetical protein